MDSRINPFRVMDIVKAAGQYDDTIHFEVGQPDLPPPPGVKRALKKAIDRDMFSSYTESKGIYSLREAISRHYAREYDVDVDPDRILITPGTSVAFMVAYQLLLDVGKRVAIADPSYPCYRNFAYMVGAEPVLVEVGAKERYLMTPALLESMELRFDALHISSPSNPTGTLYRDHELKRLSEYCSQNGIGLICDELYHGLVYNDRAPSALEYSDEHIVINGFSKYFCMPGMRIGWMVLPEYLVRRAEIVAQNLYISASTLSQYAALEAFDYDYLEHVRETYRYRRDMVYERLNELFGVETPPEGAFYIWCDVSKYTSDSFDFSEKLLTEIHVAVTPGIDFGTDERMKRYLRFSYTRDEEHLREGLDRLGAYLGSIARNGG